MSDSIIKIKRSLVAGNTPNDLSLGELAVNIPDRKIFIGDNSTDGIALIVDGNATGGTGTPAGNNTEIQFNNSGSFGSTSDLTWEESATCGSSCTTSYLELNDRSGLKLYEASGNGTNYIAFIAPSSITDTSGRPYVFPQGTTTTGSVLTLTSANNGVYTLEWTKAIVADSVDTGPINNVTITAPATAATLTIGNNKTVTVNNTLTFTGTDSSSVAFGTGGTVAYTTNKLSSFASTTSAELAGVISDETGSGALVFGTSPAFTTSVTTGSSSFDIFNTTATTINAFGAATTLTMGATSGTTTSIRGGTLVGNTATQAVFNTTATTVNAFGAATTLTIGATSGTTTTIRGGTLVGNTATQDVFNTTATTVNAFGAASSIFFGRTAGSCTWYFNSDTAIFIQASEENIPISLTSPGSEDSAGILVVGSASANGATIAFNASVISNNKSFVEFFNTGVTNLGIGGAATTLTMGATSGTTTSIRGGTLVGNTATQAVFNTTATTVNAFGAATTVNMGGASTNTVFAGTVEIDGTNALQFPDGTVQVTKTPDYLLFDMGIV